MSKEDRARLRHHMAFFRSSYVCGEPRDLHNAIDDAIEGLLNELIGEQVCLMTVEQVTVTPVMCPVYPEADPRRSQYIVTILARPLPGQYPRDIPHSRHMRRLYSEMEQKR